MSDSLPDAKNLAEANNHTPPCAFLAEIKAEIGKEPSKVGGDPGSGIKGLLCQISDKLDRLDSKVEALSTSQSSPAPNSPTAKKVAWWIAILVLAIQTVPSTYQSLKTAMSPSVANAATSK